MRSLTQDLFELVTVNPDAQVSDSLAEIMDIEGLPAKWTTDLDDESEEE